MEAPADGSRWLEPLDEDCVGAVLAFVDGRGLKAAAATTRGGHSAVAALDDAIYSAVTKDHFGEALWRRAGDRDGRWRGLWRELTTKRCGCCGQRFAQCHPLEITSVVTSTALLDAVRDRASARFSGDLRWRHMPLRSHPRAPLMVESWVEGRLDAPTSGVHLSFDFSLGGGGLHASEFAGAGTVRWFATLRPPRSTAPWQFSLHLMPENATTKGGEAPKWHVVDCWVAKFEEQRGPGGVSLKLGSFYDSGYADFYPMGIKSGRRVSPIDELRAFAAKGCASFKSTAAARLAELRHRSDEASGGSPAVLAAIDDMALAAHVHAETFHAALVAALEVCAPDATAVPQREAGASNRPS